MGNTISDYKWHRQALKMSFADPTKIICLHREKLSTYPNVVNCAEQAVCDGHLDCLRKAHQDGCPLTVFCLECAIRNKALSREIRMEMIDYLLKNHAQKNSYLYVTAVNMGDLEVVKLLHRFQVPWDERAPWNAAIHNRYDILVYLFSNGCPWDGRVVVSAQRRGHLKCLEYAVTNGCPTDYEAVIKVP